MTCLLCLLFQLRYLFQFHWILTICLLPWSPTKITFKVLKRIFCLISYSSRHHLTNCGSSCFSGDYSFRRGHDQLILIRKFLLVDLVLWLPNTRPKWPLYSVQIDQTLWRTTSWRRVCFFLFLKWYAFLGYSDSGVCCLDVIHGLCGICFTARTCWTCRT